MNDVYQVQISTSLEDSAWDKFVESSPGGHFSQTSLWAQVKASLGWKVARVIISINENRIVAGAQILIRTISPFGAMAYVSKGPVYTSENIELADLLIDELHRIRKLCRIQYLAVQPPNNGETFVKHLLRWGFKKTLEENINPPGTILIDLTQDNNDILAQMRTTVRKTIGRSQRKGVKNREGSERDLHTLYQFLVATSKRKRFTANTEAYLFKMWEVFNPIGYFKLFCAEYGDEPISALLAIPYKDTVTTWRRGWSGEHGNLHPNVALYWQVIQWAKSHNYHYIDLGGIQITSAKKILQGEKLPDEAFDTFTFFKLGFGGKVVLYPETYDFVYNPLLRWAYNCFYPIFVHWPVTEKIISLISRR
jgi:lipid II:glycine glycyltransferase (peptidoglycan interpeptide bridge formation enzyme)